MITKPLFIKNYINISANRGVRGGKCHPPRLSARLDRLVAKCCFCKDKR